MSYPIGIDLGTTNSVVCVYRRGQVETIPVESRPVMPSAVSVLPDGNVLVGAQAKGRAMISPEQSITSVKRVIGDGKSEWNIGGKTFTSVDVSALVIGQLKKAAEEFLGESVSDAVVTVPAYFNNNQKRDTKIAAEAAGLNVLQLLPEPTAAAISYGLDKGKDQTIMVYDLGGGTFDVSILEIQGNRFKVIAVDGDFTLGGDDLDLLLVDHLINVLKDKTKSDLGILRSLFKRKKKFDIENIPPKEMLLAKQQLKEIAEKAKKDLSEIDTALVQIPSILGTSLDEEISIKDYNKMIEPLVKKTVDKIKAVLKAAKLSKRDIDRVILVGGSTRNRLVKEMVTAATKEPYIADRVDEAVAQGAGIVAGYLFSPDIDALPMEFINVTPFSLGVCSYEHENQSRYVNSIIISKDTSVPCVNSRQYEVRTQRSDENILEVYLLQGESQDPAECLVLGKYSFSGVSHDPSGLAKVDIQYGYDESGIITVAAHESASKKELELTIESLSEDMSWLSELPSDGAFDPKALNILVTPAGYDDVGKALSSLKLPFKVYNNENILDCDIFFWNCLASTYPEPSVVSRYVSEGGCLYASCCVAEHMKSVFSDVIKFDHSGCRSETITAEIVDQTIESVLGKEMDIEYDQAACYTITYLGEGSKILLKEAKSRKHVMVMIPFGKGYIFYTCFHHHDGLSRKEKLLLEMLIMTQVSVASGIPIEVVQKSLNK